ncbi:MAG: long-chain fatty acid--CoA ligase, partial [Proteobacteria bacterium]|nr:long-chain fatty acid--CoA ligase [Pseudomonadota bacterium]
AFQLCLAHPDFKQYDLSSVQLIVWGGASAPQSLLHKLLKICPRLSTSYGQTESVGSLTFVEACDDIDLLSTSVGQPVPEYDVRIVDSSGNVAAPGETGEIQARGDFIMRGYWNNPAATAEAIRDGWLCTGDLAIEDTNGHYRLVGRLKEMFISGGYNVFPLEIEQVLESHSAVAMAAVVSVPDELFSEVGHAWILREPGITITVDELAVFCREQLANYKVPKTIFIRNELPMLPIGKLDRQALRKESLKAVSDDKINHGATEGTLPDPDR